VFRFKGDGAAVLIRALQPIEGLDEMRKTRAAKNRQEKYLKDHELCNGPSKLTLVSQTNYRYSCCVRSRTILYAMTF